ncbi:MAG: cell division protein ZapD [Gallionella sp.]
MITYEFPLNEKVRTLLRLEDLFTRIEYFLQKDSSTDHHAALLTLFEIFDVACRADLKSELLQEMERQKRYLSSLQNNPAISKGALGQVLAELDESATNLFATTGKIGQEIRENEWLMGIKQRTVIPGGTCEFDLPSYHYWQQQNADSRRTSLQAWLAPFLPLNAGLKIILKLLRENGKTRHFTAAQGAFQQMQGGHVAQILRVRLDDKLDCIPEVSANKYAINIRFIVANYAAKSSQVAQDIPFEMTFCSLSS